MCETCYSGPWFLIFQESKVESTSAITLEPHRYLSGFSLDSKELVKCKGLETVQYQKKKKKKKETCHSYLSSSSLHFYKYLKFLYEIYTIFISYLHVMHE